LPVNFRVLGQPEGSKLVRQSLTIWVKSILKR